MAGLRRAEDVGSPNSKGAWYHFRKAVNPHLREEIRGVRGSVPRVGEILVEWLVAVFSCTIGAGLEVWSHEGGQLSEVAPRG